MLLLRNDKTPEWPKCLLEWFTPTDAVDAGVLRFRAPAGPLAERLRETASDEGEVLKEGDYVFPAERGS